MNWREYHESTKHSVASLRQRPHGLDWSNMPDPFRHYEGVPLLDLPADPPPPQAPALEVLLDSALGTAPAPDGPTFLSQLFFYSAAISASRRVPSTGYRYALRVNPSSGNLHPTEFHFATQGLKDWPNGVYHYRPSSHMAEQRARGTQVPGIRILLTSIAAREAWKYGDRGYRYCLLDIGHAWQAVALAARAMGCGTTASGHFADCEIARSFRLASDEWPMLVMKLTAPRVEADDVQDVREPVWYGGEPDPLSPQPIPHPNIDAFHDTTRIASLRTLAREPATPEFTGSGQWRLPLPHSTRRSFAEVARMRRSALDFKVGPQRMSLAQLSAILASATHPLGADFATESFVRLYLYVHNVVDLSPGVYRLWRQMECGLELECIRAGDQRVQAAGLSLGQDLAGNACIAFSMIADIERAVSAFGDRGYRYVHFEAGAIGHRLYLAAEALGLAATGIGAFYDERVHEYLNLDPARGQVVYHFAIGYAVPDSRTEDGR